MSNQSNIYWWIAECEKQRLYIEHLRSDNAKLREACKANLIILKANYEAIKSLPFESLGVVQPTHAHPGYPIRDEALHEIAVRIKATEAALEETK